MSISSTGYYILFGGEEWYPRGGAADILCSSHDLNSLLSSITPVDQEEYLAWEINIEGKIDQVSWWHIFDTHNVAVVAMSLPRTRNDFAVKQIIAANCRITDEKTGILLP